MRYALAVLASVAVLAVREMVRRKLTDNEDLFALGVALVLPLVIIFGGRK